MTIYSATELAKAMYTRRWRGPNGQWQYEYGNKGTGRQKRMDGSGPFKDGTGPGCNGGTPRNMKKVSAADTRKLNTALAEAIPGSYHDSIPMAQIADAFDKRGFKLLDEDGTEWNGMMTGAEGRASIPLGHVSSQYDVNGIPTYKELDGAHLQIQWYKMKNKYEITSYVM